MAQLGKYARLLLDSYLVSSDTSNMKLRLSRGRLDAPTHESPSAFLTNELTGQLDVDGYIASSPNAFVLEKRLQDVFGTPDNTHYAALIPDYRITGFTPVYSGTIQASKVAVKAQSKSVLTINGGMRLQPDARATLGDQSEAFRGGLLYYSEAVTTGNADYVTGPVIDLGVTPVKAEVHVVAFTLGESVVLLWNAQFSSTSDGVFADGYEADESLTGPSVDLASSDNMDRYVKFRFKLSAGGPSSIGLAAWVKYI